MTARMTGDAGFWNGMSASIIWLRLATNSTGSGWGSFFTGEELKAER